MTAECRNLPSHANGIRESMLSLPAWLQPALTWITGKALPGQKPLIRGNHFTQILAPLVGLFGGSALAWYLFTRGGASMLGLLPVWLVMVGAARKLQVTIAHQCAHYCFTGNRKFDRFMGQALTTLILVDHFDSYYHEHVEIHHTKQLGSGVDPDCKFLLELGFKPGQPVSSLWNHLLRVTVSPAFHFKFLKARVKANFVTAPLARRLSAIAFHTSVFATVIGAGAMAPFFFAWMVPVFCLYHVAALLNFSSLHFWLKQPSPSHSAKQTICTLTAGRFLGERAPSSELSGTEAAAAWMRWSLRMLFVHLPGRVGVLSGDLPVHDYHHRHARCPEWADYLYTRQWDIDAGCPGWPMPYTEHWGLGNAIFAVMETIAAAPADLLEGVSFPEGAAEKAMIQN